MKKIELTPTDGRQSFYGKCYVIEKGTKATLYSYDTRIATIDTEAGTLKKYKAWNFSATTKRHQRAFLEAYGVTA